MNALEVSNLHFSYKSYSLFRTRQTPVLRGASFALEQNRALGLLGASGSGKSTIAALLMQILAPDSGEIKLFGEPLSAPNLDKRRALYRQMQIVFQDPLGAVNPRNSVRECIEEPLNYLFDLSASERARRVRSALDLVELSESLLSKPALNLSGGQIQRVLIARALAIAPKILILDESLSSLDAFLQVKFIRFLSRLKTHYSFLFITHDVRLARLFCDEIILLEAGKIVEKLTPPAAFTSPLGKQLDAAILR